MRKFGMFLVPLMLCATMAMAQSKEARANAGAYGLWLLSPAGDEYRHSLMHYEAPAVSPNSVVNNQGGSTGKNCDNGTGLITALNPTQIASDNGNDPHQGSGLTWNYSANGNIDLTNTGTSAVLANIDVLTGDQTVCGTNFACYFDSTQHRYIVIPAGAALAVPWTMLLPGQSDDNHFKAFYVLVTFASGTHNACAAGTNAYTTVEHDN